MGVSVGTTTLEAEPALNHISGGGNPTFTVTVENAGEFPETDVKVDVTVTAAGKQYQGLARDRHDRTGQDQSTSKSPSPGVPLGTPAKIEVHVEPVPGETNHENNKARLPGDLRRIGARTWPRGAARGAARRGGCASG